MLNISDLEKITQMIILTSIWIYTAIRITPGVYKEIRYSQEIIRAIIRTISALLWSGILIPCLRGADIYPFSESDTDALLSFINEHDNYIIWFCISHFVTTYFFVCIVNGLLEAVFEFVRYIISRVMKENDKPVSKSIYNNSRMISDSEIKTFGDSYFNKHLFKPNDIVKLKLGLSTYTRPSYGEAALVLEVDPTRRCDGPFHSSTEHEPSDLRIGVINEGRFYSYWVDSARFEPFKGTGNQ